MEIVEIGDSVVEETIDGGGKNVIGLKKRGDDFFKQKNFEQALECYSRALERDKSNFELRVSRAETYFKLKEYYKGLCDITGEIILSTLEGKNESPLLFRAFKLFAEFQCLEYLAGRASWEYVDEIFRRAMRLNVCSGETELLIRIYNKTRKGCQRESNGQIEKLISNVRILNYYSGGKAEAIQELTKAIELDQADPLAYACRAVCYADCTCDSKDKLINDIKECIELDYRYTEYFFKVSDELKLLGRIESTFSLLEALNLSKEAYKQSVGKFFPKLAANRALNKSERKRFTELNQSWRENHLKKLETITVFSTGH